MLCLSKSVHLWVYLAENFSSLSPTPFVMTLTVPTRSINISCCLSILKRTGVLQHSQLRMLGQVGLSVLRWAGCGAPSTFIDRHMEGLRRDGELCSACWISYASSKVYDGLYWRQHEILHA